LVIIATLLRVSEPPVRSRVVENRAINVSNDRPGF
jgi:hypothetical protein